jgi:UDP-N-acetylmuramate dehydrogenase
MREWAEPKWFESLPEAAGTFARNVALADYTTILVGGPAEVFATVPDWDAMALLVRWCNAHAVPLTLIGKGSNMVIRDGGIAGIVTHVAKGFDAVEVEDNVITAEAGAACGTVARAAREAELEGMAFFGGIPGSVGGALRMNAGAYGHETYAKIKTLWLIDAAGEVQEVEPEFVAPRYRGTALPEGWIYKAASWELSSGNKEEIRKQMQEINRARSTSQPLHLPSSGSWFKNVKRDGETVNAWKIVDEAGCRGMRVGGAMVSEQHSNFFVNIGATEKDGKSATAVEFEELSLKVEATILEKLGITMEREVRFTGVE